MRQDLFNEGNSTKKFEYYYITTAENHMALQALATKAVDSAYFQEITHLLRVQFPPTVGFLPHLSFKNWGGEATLDRAALRR